MLFLVMGTDGPEAPALRKAWLQQHLDWVLGAMPAIRVAGPLLESSDGAPCASLYVIEAEDQAAAETLLAGDPYHLAGVWRSVTLMPFKAAAGTWVGGAAWLAPPGKPTPA